MIISLALIAAVAIYHVSPWVLMLLIITWVPDIVITAMLLDCVG